MDIQVTTHLEGWEEFKADTKRLEELLVEVNRVIRKIDNAKITAQIERI